MGEKRKDPPAEGWPSEAVPGTKWICFVRHAQALHNVCEDNLWTPDNPLTEEGEKQCEEAHKEWGDKIFSKADLIVVSPMTRALQTGYIISGKKGDLNWTVTPMCSEKLSGATCDEGRPKTELVKNLPWMSAWKGVAELDEEWWTAKRPPEEERVTEFLKFLEEQKEEKIVVVSHGAFLQYIVGYHLPNANHHIMPVTEFKGITDRLARSSFNLSAAVVGAYKDSSLHELKNAPLKCFAGIGEKQAALLGTLGLKTVQSLGDWKYAKWAEAICILAQQEQDGAQDVSHIANKININKALVKDWEGWAMSFLLGGQPSAFTGLSPKHDQYLSGLDIKTIKDLGEWKYYKWAKSICTLASLEDQEGKS